VTLWRHLIQPQPESLSRIVLMRPRKPLNEAQAERLYRRGLSLQQVAAEFGVSAEHVRHILQRAGVVLRSRGRQRLVDPAQAARLYQSPMSLRQVAEVLGCAPSTVWNCLNDLGVVRDAHATHALRWAPVRAQVLAAWRTGHNVTQSARLAGCSVTTASEYIRAAGYTPRRRQEAGCGPLIRAARRQAGLTQMELARRIRVTRALISAYERGRTNPSRLRLRQIAGGAGCPLHQLLP
jgi:transcriptional regulator with XRE-family HTH domain